jgi:putative toxin-antitoxin system antitoxin component (TIGR02293 family)
LKYLGNRIKDTMGFDRIIREGIPFEASNYAKEALRLSDREFADTLGISRRTLGRKKKAHSKLSPVESDRLYRLVKIFVLAVTVLEGRDQAVEWLHSRQIALGGRVPLDMMKTAVGAQEVEDLLVRIEYGTVL